MTRCSKCRKMFFQRLIELDAKYQVVCPECYLQDVPAEDVYGALLDIEFAAKREAA